MKKIQQAKDQQAADSGTSVSSVEPQMAEGELPAPRLSIFHFPFSIFHARRTRRASVLILVVALLVLMALIGTAYISSTRIERYTSNQNSANTQIDLLVQGVKNLVTSSIVGKLYDPASTGAAAFRLAANAVTQYSYTPYESPLSDVYLASRVPEIIPLATGGGGAWPAITWPLLVSNSTYQLDDPTTGISYPLALPYGTPPHGTPPNLFYQPGDIVAVGSPNPTLYQWQVVAQPTAGPPGPNWKPIPQGKGLLAMQPTSKLVNGTAYPAFYIFNTAITEYINPTAMLGYGPTPYAFLAADADGDGIADSVLWKLPIGPINGITYYAAVRVIDQNSAVNASTAWSSSFDFDATYTYGPVTAGTPPAVTKYMGIFRSNVGLRELLYPTTADNEMQALNAFRLNSGGTPTAYLTPIADPIPANPPTTPAVPAKPRTDFTFLTQGDAFESQLVRRPGNPGYNSNISGTLGNSYQWLSTDTVAALAHGFCIKSTSLGNTELENDLYNELVTLCPTAPYSASNAGNTNSPGTWFGNNFDYSSTAPTPPQMPIRPLVVSSNPVSNAVSGHYAYQGLWTAGTAYHFGDWVYTYQPSPPAPNATTPGYCFVCIQDHTASLVNEPTPAMATLMATETWTTPESHQSADAYWAYVPWTTTPTKASANTAPFGALMAAYWNVFWDHFSPTLNGFAQPFSAHPAFALDPSNQVANQNIAPLSIAPYPARMFRSPIRDPSNSGPLYPPTPPGQYLTPGQTMLLRSGLAALNTISLRRATGSNSPPPPSTGLDDVISRMISIPKDPADLSSNAYNVMLFGATKQPYISEVYVEMDPVTAGNIKAIAIELSNPYPTAMTLTNWQIGWVNRASVSYAEGISPGLVFAGGVPVPVGPPVSSVPAATATGPGKLIITDGTPTGSWPSPSPSVNVVAVLPANALTAAGTKELIILRPRSNAGTFLPTGNPDPVNTYNEGTASSPTYAELVPVDQIDLGALTSANPAYFYRRATVSGSAGWNFVYPGSYSFANATTNPYRQAGIMPFAIAGASTSLGLDKNLSTGAVPKASYQTYPIQIANTDSAGWNQATAAGPNNFPFGGFARNGDLLQVPFIGAYRIIAASVLPAAPPVSAATPIVEMNSLPMDSAFADDQDATTQMSDTEATNTVPPTALREQIGRFCVVGDPAGATPAAVADFNPPLAVASIANSNVNWRYQWASKLFDFLTVQAPTDDYMPNTDPLSYRGATAVVPQRNQGNPNIVNAGNNTVNPLVTPGTSEDTTPVEGLVNINTAPWPVIAALPWFPNGYTDPTNYPTCTTTQQLTQALAQAIVLYRNTNGPFHSVNDLYKVTATNITIPPAAAIPTVTFKQLADDLNVDAVTSATKALADGDFSPSAIGPDGVKYDFEKRFLLINRVSNLITTRSDAFTCYILLQGWSGVGTGNPTLVAQRRIAFVLDRSPASALPTSTNYRKFNQINVPQN